MVEQEEMVGQVSCLEVVLMEASPEHEACDLAIEGDAIMLLSQQAGLTCEPWHCRGEM